MFFKMTKMNCPICFEDRRRNVILKGGHTSCNKCHKKYIKSTIDRKCHICRSPIKSNSIKFNMNFHIITRTIPYPVPIVYGYYGIYGFLM